VSTQCTLTILLGGQVIYSGLVYTTDGNYTTVTTVATFPGGPVTSLIVNEYCPGNAPTMSIGDVSVGGSGSSSSSSSMLSTVSTSPSSSSTTPPTTTSTTGTTTGPGPNTFSSSSTTSTFPPAETGTTSNTATTLPTTTIPPTATMSAKYGTFSAADYYFVTGQCSYSAANTAGGCTLSGAPVATSGLLAVATGIPSYLGANGDYDKAYQECAYSCNSFSECNSYSLDRTDPSFWTCYLYSGFVMDYAANYNRAYSAIDWFGKGCYTCGGSSTSSTPTTTSSSATVPSTTTSNAAGTQACTKRNPYITNTNARCQASPTVIPPAMASATGITVPVPPNYDLDGSYAQCARICANTPGCNGFILDVGNWAFGSAPASFTCFFYQYTAQDSSLGWSPYYSGKIWVDKSCYGCETPTSADGSMITTAPRTISAPDVSDRGCTEFPHNLATACDASGIPLPTMRPALVVATGLPPGPFNWAQDADTACAAVCLDTAGCTAWAIDRDDWTCYAYGNLDLMRYWEEVNFQNNHNWEADNKYKWKDSRCFSCPALSSTASTSESSSTTTETSSSTTESSVTTTDSTSSSTTSETSSEPTSTTFSSTSSTSTSDTSTITSAPVTTAAIPLRQRTCEVNSHTLRLHLFHI
jgi:hypothetical protein